ncbi:MAG TPA: DUF6600 domain-containing protein [Bryobacteraceae bacterium]|nr:DUF6600 domain-containing protein [Bryobacteraceae bacterium]
MKNRLALAVVLVAGVLEAQGPPPGAYPPGPQGPMPPQAGDPPARVARLDLIQGPVSFQPAGVDNWTAATPNYPLTTGDHLYADAGARAEMHIFRNAIRLNSQTNFGFLNVDDRTVQMTLTGGAVEARIRTLGPQDLYELDTPNGAISFLRDGNYRVDFDPTRNGTMVTVFAGEAEVMMNGQAVPVHPRQTAWFSEGAPPDIRGLNPPDDFDRFTNDLNRREDMQPPARHVHPEMIGGEDLDVYGTWRDDPMYGPVWVPPVGPGWAPYRTGHWVWVAPWGWTWVDDAPWGFAPFHYGRWAFVGGTWVWIPGAVAVRPVYAPALVAFVGGPHFSIGIGIGGGPMAAVAWFPLGPQEVFRPAYAVSPVYVRNVNVTNVTNVTNITNVNVTNVRYINQGVAGAATAVPQNAFTSGRPVNTVMSQVTPQQMANAQIAHTAPVAPTQASVLGSSTAAVAQPPRAMLGRPVVTKATPPPAPVSFGAQQAALAQNGGRPLAPAQVAQIRQQQPSAVSNAQAVRPAGMARPAAPAPASRFESRPPTASQPAPAAGEPGRTAEFNRPQPTAPQPAARPAPATPAQPAARPAPQQQQQQRRPAGKKEEKEKEERR